jgi:GT2 family glycosyltransferase
MDDAECGSPPVVSVIIPTYNRWPLVREALESVLAQSYRCFEIVLVDDGSTDGTSEKLREIDGPVRLIAQTNGGVSSARNRGVAVAQGKYVAFLDSDDLWLPKKLATQVEFLDTHSNYQICQTEEVWLRRGVRVNPKKIHRKPSGDIFAPSLELCLVSPSAVMMTRELLVAMGGFDESLPVCEDYDLWLRIAVQCQVPLIPAPLVIKRGGHADQLSHSLWGLDRYRVLALQKLLRAGLSGVKRQQALDALRRKVAILAHGAKKRGKAAEARAFEMVLTEFTQESYDVGSGDSRIRAGKRVSWADSGTLA